jgi:hypothetical protein
MSTSAAPRIFISYSRKDGAEFAAQLRGDLEAKGFGIWQDLVALQGGRDWWSQIEAALKSKALQHFILVVTPGALWSSRVRRQIRLARQEGKTFLPIKGPGLGDPNALPRWIGRLADLDIPEHWVTLQRILQDDSGVKRVAPEPRRLLDVKGDAEGITALRGAGGSGKTTLERALAHDPDIQRHGGRVEALAVLFDDRLASGGDDRTIRLWDPARGAETARLASHGGWVLALAVLPDGRLASGSFDRTIRLWAPASGAETARLAGHGGWVLALAVLPDGRLASGGDDRTIRLWDPASGAETARLGGHDGL